MKTGYPIFILLIFFAFIKCSDNKTKNNSEEVKTLSAPKVKTIVLIDDIILDGNESFILADSVHLNKESANVPAVVNENEENHKYFIADNIEIIMQTFDYDDDGSYKVDQKILLNQLKEAILENERYSFIPFEITTLGNKIIRISEIYIP